MNPVREIAIQRAEAGPTTPLLSGTGKSLRHGDQDPQEGEELPAKNHFCKFRPLLDRKGLLRVGGRLDNTPWAYEIKHPVILPKKAHVTHLLLKQFHHLNLHPGPSTMMSLLAQGYYISGVRGAVRELSHNWVTCQRVYARTSNQLMGKLRRLHPSPPLKYGNKG